MGLVPLFLSISSFVYDYYSDVELTLQYYYQSTYAVDCSIEGKCPGRQPILDDGTECKDYAFKRTRGVRKEFSFSILVELFYVNFCVPIFINLSYVYRNTARLFW